MQDRAGAAMHNEDEEPRPKPQLFSPPPLDRLGVAELRAYVDQLQSEIERTETEIRRKDAIRNAADSVFRRPE